MGSRDALQARTLSPSNGTTSDSVARARGVMSESHLAGSDHPELRRGRPPGTFRVYTNDEAPPEDDATR